MSEWGLGQLNLSEAVTEASRNPEGFPPSPRVMEENTIFFL